jgi:hypothetical protein
MIDDLAARVRMVSGRSQVTVGRKRRRIVTYVMRGLYVRSVSHSSRNRIRSILKCRSLRVSAAKIWFPSFLVVSIHVLVPPSEKKNKIMSTEATIIGVVKHVRGYVEYEIRTLR